jgi:hypothetical protein
MIRRSRTSVAHRRQFPRFELARTAMGRTRAGLGWAARGIGAAAFAFTMSACGAEQAEVGADPPRDGGPPRTDAPFGDAPVDGSDDGGTSPCNRQMPLRLYARNLRTAASSPDINFIIKIENQTGAAIDTSALEARYYFTNELDPPTVVDIFYTDTCCSNKKTDFNAGIVTSVESLIPVSNADTALRMAFAPSVGMLANGDAVQVEIGFHDVGYVRSMTQTNDYSFAASAGGTQSQWDSCPGPECDAKFTTCAITVHRGGVLVWGTPP